MMSPSPTRRGRRRKGLRANETFRLLMPLYGYARVSTLDQDQIRALFETTLFAGLRKAGIPEE
jgi:hypothetical protein